MSRRRAVRTLPIHRVGALAVLAALALLACRASRTPSPTPIPSPTPTRTPDALSAMDEAVFAISLDGRLIGVETLRLGEEAGALLAFAELVRADALGTTERRTVVLNEALLPLRYDLKIGARGVRSIWVAERRGEGMDVLNNNLAWFGPVLVEGVSPAPDVILEGMPSALPYALLALQDYGPKGLQGRLQVQTLDVLADLPATGALSLTVDVGRQGTVIGTIAVEGRWQDGGDPAFTMWVRPGSRALYSVEIPSYRPSVWERRWGAVWGRVPESGNGTGTILIERVSSPPDLPLPTPPVREAQRIAVTFTSHDGTRLAGTLSTPPGQGPHACVILLGPGGMMPRWDPGDAAARHGWATLSYDPRGVGESGGDYERDRPALQAMDAVAAIAMLQERPEIDSQRIVVLGIGAGGLAGALALANDSPTEGASVVAAVLASLPGPGPLFPTLPLHQISTALAPDYDWEAGGEARYAAMSVTRWQEWLFEDVDEVTLLRRRISLRSLHDLADLDLAKVLAAAKAPILLVQGGEDPWIPTGAAQALADALAASGAPVEAHLFGGLGHDLGWGSDPTALLSPEVDDVVWSWLNAAREPEGGRGQDHRRIGARGMAVLAEASAARKERDIATRTRILHPAEEGGMSTSPRPDRLLSVLRHEGLPGPVPWIELFADQPIMEEVLGYTFPAGVSADREANRARADALIAFYRRLGYDYVPVSIGSVFTRSTAAAVDTAALSKGTRNWDNSSTGMISSWADFEAYPWPDLNAIDYSPAKEMLARIPDDMGAIAMGSGGVLEWAMWLMGYETLALALYDQPDLVQAVFNRVITTLSSTCAAMLDLGGFLAYFVGDDMGHSTGTMVSPEVLRRYVFPGQERLVDIAHDHGVPFLLHTCGNLAAVMDDLIDSVGIDAKHSFEDKIAPVEDEYARYGARIALLGGVDVDLLARGTEEQVRARTRQLLDALGPSGSWCLGTGNSVANYVSVRNYLAMLDEGRAWNERLT